MATTSSSNESDDINSLNKEIDELNNKLTNLVAKSNERGVVSSTSDNRRIEKLQETINNLKLKRQLLLKKSFTNRYIKPVITNDLEAGIQATQGESMTIKISASGTPKPAIVWMRGNDALVPNDRIQVITPTTEGDDTYTLIIVNVQLEEQGDYSAKITNAAGSVKSKRCKFVVTKSPIFIAKPTIKEVKQGETAVCETKIAGYPTPKITWLLNGKPLTSKDGVQVELNEATGDAKLSIPKVDLQQHAGIVTCQLENVHGTQEETVRLDILAAPTIATQLPKQEETVSGKDVTLRVTVHGLPRPQAQWFYNDKPVAPENVTFDEGKSQYQLLVKQPTVATSEGTYRVVLKNKFGETESTPCVLTILEPVKLTKVGASPDVLDLEVGEPFEISFDVDGKEIPKVQLTKDGKEVKFTSVAGTRHTYSVSDVKPEHQGVYKVTAKNKTSSEKASVTLNVPSVKKVDNKQFLDGDWNEEKEGSLALVTKKQAELKAYYDNFPDIDDAINQAGSDLKEAKELTESILHNLPSGDVDEAMTVCHVLNKLFENRNIQCLFFDSTHGSNLHDAFNNLAEMDLEDRPFVLKLNSSEGLGDSIEPKTEHGAIRFVQTLNNTIRQNESHPIIEDLLDRLSTAHGIDKKDICIKTVYVGTFNVVYTVKDLANRVVKSLTNVAQKLKHQFDQFLSAKIHPLLYRPSFDISCFDKLGNKTFSSQSEAHQVGPPGNTMPYILPIEWTRYGLKVLGKYKDGDKWLRPFQDPENWYRAFHGTGRAIAADFDNSKQPFDQQYASIDAVGSIYKNEFRPARVAAYESGVYCSPNPKFPEKGYITPVQLDTQQGKKTFKCMLQVAVNPNGVQFTSDKDIWVVPNPQDIRPYGILIKEAN